MHEHGTGQLWWGEPFWLLLIPVGLCLTYLYAVRQGQKNAKPACKVPRQQVVLFLCGSFVTLLALIPPVDKVSMSLFTGHMIQHLLLSLVAPPLLICGLPVWWLGSLVQHRIIRQIGRFLTFPLVAGTLFNANIWLWHAPPLYQQMHDNHLLHVWALLLYLATGILFWWPVLSSQPVGRPSLSIGGKLIYILLSDMPMMLLGAGLTFMPPLYAQQASSSTLWGISPTLDQQLGGLLMWVGGSLFVFAIACGLFLQWMLQQERQQQREEQMEISSREMARQDR